MPKAETKSEMKTEEKKNTKKMEWQPFISKQS